MTPSVSIFRLLGATELVGTDAAEELLGNNSQVKDQIMASFHDVQATPLPKPSFSLVDIADTYHPVFRSGHFHCIITDPPYSIKEKVRGKGGGAVEGQIEAEEERALALQSIVKLFHVASHTLVPGGRLVFFLPSWGRHNLHVSYKGTKKDR